MAAPLTVGTKTSAPALGGCAHQCGFPHAPGLSQVPGPSRSQDLQEQRANATYIATSLFQADGSHSYSR